jgi:mannitol-1-/sugar-/sorbitol-6-phosphatase
MHRISCLGLLFDMDGVLVDSTPAVARVWGLWATQHGFDTDSIIKRAHGRPSLATLQELLPDAGPRVHAEENDWMERAEIADIADVIALPGTRELLSSLPSNKFAIVTSATRELADVRLRAAGLSDFVRHLITADDIQRGKPDPEPYQKGAASLGFNPADCIVVEDATAGARSGKAAGARVIGLRTTTPDEELLAAGADWIINDCSWLEATVDPKDAALQIELRDSPTERRTPKMH